MFNLDRFFTWYKLIRQSNRGWRFKIFSILRLYEELDREVSRFKTSSGLNCVAGCGRCCQSPKVESTVLEVMPLALDLWQSGKAPETLDRLEQGKENPVCVFYRPDPVIPDNGRCGIYPFRPLICRLYGFSAVLNKHQRKNLNTCAVIKSVQALEVQSAQQKIEQGLSVPVMSNFGHRLFSIDSAFGTKRLPINAAVRQALERVGLEWQLQSSRKKKNIEGH